MKVVCETPAGVLKTNLGIGLSKGWHYVGDRRTPAPDEELLGEIRRQGRLSPEPRICARLYADRCQPRGRRQGGSHRNSQCLAMQGADRRAAKVRLMRLEVT